MPGKRLDQSETVLLSDYLLSNEIHNQGRKKKKAFRFIIIILNRKVGQKSPSWSHGGETQTQTEGSWHGLNLK